MSTNSNFWNVIRDGSAINPNILHSYENVTYDITLGMTTEPVTRLWLKYESSQDKVPNLNSFQNKEIFSDEMIILAQTGGTVAQITRLDVEGVASPNTVSSLTYSTNFRMNITQPLGSSFLRNIYKSATILGIQNHYSHPFFLQVYLKGRKKGDQTITQEIPGTKRVYAIYISNMTYRVEMGATVYDVTAIRASDVAKADDHQLIQDISIDQEISNFGDFLNAFQEKLKEQERHYLGQSKLLLDQYEFKVRGPWKGGNSQETDDERKEKFLSSVIQDDFNATNIANKGKDEGSVKVEINKNTSVREILEKFIARNVFAQKEIKAVREQLNKSFSNEEWENLRLSKFITMITCHHEILKYDPLRRDYQKKFIWTINIQDFQTISSAVRDELTPNEAYSKKRANQMLQRKHIVKRYDYFNTGMNLDVMNFDINFNFQYVYGLDTVVGLYNRYGSALNDTISDEANASALNAKLVEQGATNQAYMASGADASGEDFRTLQLRRDTLNLAQQAYNNFDVEPDANTLEAYNQLVEIYNQDIEKYDANTPVLTSRNTLGEIQQIDNSQFAGKNRDDSKTIGKVSRFSETLSEKITDQRYIDAANLNGTQFPVQFYERYFDPETQGMTEVGAGSEFQTVIRNAKVGSAEMVKAELDIIGDPYWLDKPEFSAPFDSTEAVNFKRENVILFVARMPSEELKDADRGSLSGDLRQKSDQFLTALYRIWKVDNTFDGGQFTTKLHMVRDTITDLGLVMSEDSTFTENNKADASNKIDTTVKTLNSDGTISTSDNQVGEKQESVTADDGFKSNSDAIKTNASVT